MLHLIAARGCVWLCLLLAAPASARSLAVLGGSMTTGAGTDPGVEFRFSSLWERVTGVRSRTPDRERLEDRPTVLWRSPREYHGAFDWVFHNLLSAFTKVFLDTPERAWPSLLAEKMGVAGHRVLIAAEDGARMADITRQSDKVLIHGKGALPEDIFIFFAAGDLCAPAFEALTPSEVYGEQLWRGLRYLIINGSPPPAGTRIWVGGFLRLPQWLTRPEITGHEVMAHGEKRSCGELRAALFQPKAGAPGESVDHPEAGMMRYVLPPNPVGLCPTVFGLEALAAGEIGFFARRDPARRKRAVKEWVGEHISELAGRVRHFHREAEKAVDRAQAFRTQSWPGKEIAIRFIAETGELAFDGSELAPDCFHLREGHKRVADAFHRGMTAAATAPGSRSVQPTIPPVATQR